MASQRLVLVLAVGTLVLASCSTGSEGESAPIAAADPPTTAPADTTAPPVSNGGVVDTDVVVPTALQFTAPLVGGGDIDASALADKPTVFWFWAPT